MPILSCILLFFIFFLVLTGGTKLGALELSQVNVFGIVLTALVGLQSFKRSSGQGMSVDQLFPGFFKDLSPSALRIFAGAVLFGTFGFYTILHWFEYSSLNANAYDFTFIEQSIWKTAFLWPKGQSVFLGCDIAKAGTYLGEHAAFILAFLSPLYLLADTAFHMAWIPSFLLVAALYAVGVRKRQISLEAVALILFFALTPSFRGAASFQFREDAFFLPLGILIINAALTGRSLFFLFCSLALFVVKENAAFLAVFLGAWVFVALPGKARTKPRLWRGLSLGLILFSVLVFYLWNFVLAPHFAAPGEEVMMTRRLSFLGPASQGLLSAFLDAPVDMVTKILRFVLDMKSLKYGLSVFGPYLFFIPLMARRQPFLLFASFCLWGLNLLFTPRTTGFHYDLIFMPLLWSALILSITRPGEKKRPSLLWLFLGLLCFFGRSPVLLLRAYWPTSRQVCVRKVLEAVPRSFVVATQGALMPALHRRQKVQLLRDFSEQTTEFVAFSKLEGISAYAAEGVNEMNGKLSQGPAAVKFFPLLSSTDLELWCRNDIKSKCFDWVNHFQFEERGLDKGSCSSLSEAMARTNARAAETKVQ